MGVKYKVTKRGRGHGERQRLLQPGKVRDEQKRGEGSRTASRVPSAGTRAGQRRDPGRAGPRAGRGESESPAPGFRAPAARRPGGVLRALPAVPAGP